MNLEKKLHRLKVRNYKQQSVIINGARRLIGNATFFELLELVALHDGTLFTAEAATRYNDISSSVGRGEVSIRIHYNLPLATVGTRGSIDIWENNREVKEATDNGVIKPGDAAATYWANAKDSLIYDDAEGLVAVDQLVPYKFLQQNIPTDVLHTLSSWQSMFNKPDVMTWAEAINIGVSKNLLNKVPPSVKARLENMMTPSKFLDYPGIYYVWSKGFIDIPKEVFDEAWEPVNVSQQKPRVKLRRSYLENRALNAYFNLKDRKKILMKKVGLIAASCKPFHNGHYRLIDIASRENDIVMLYVSLSDRSRPGEVKISGTLMAQLWKDHFEKILPKNVVVQYTSSSGTTPVRKVYEFLGKENEEGSDDSYKIYGMIDSLDHNFPSASLEKYANMLFTSGRLYVEPISKSMTSDISGTMMRSFIANGDKESFVANLPPDTHAEAIWDTIIQSGVTITPTKVPKRRKR